MSSVHIIILIFDSIKQFSVLDYGFLIYQLRKYLRSFRRLTQSNRALVHVVLTRRSVAQWVRRGAHSWPGKLITNVGG